MKYSPEKLDQKKNRFADVPDALDRRIAPMLIPRLSQKNKLEQSKAGGKLFYGDILHGFDGAATSDSNWFTARSRLDQAKAEVRGVPDYAKPNTEFLRERIFDPRRDSRAYGAQLTTEELIHGIEPQNDPLPSADFDPLPRVDPWYVPSKLYEVEGGFQDPIHEREITPSELLVRIR